MTLYRRLEDPAKQLRFKLIRRDLPVLLSDALPVLENMGLKVLSEEPSEIGAADGHRYWLHDFGARPGRGRPGRGRGGSPVVPRPVLGRVGRAAGERRLQPAGARGRIEPAPDRDLARLLPLHPADRLAVQPSLYRADDGGESDHRPRSRGPVRRALRPRPAGLEPRAAGRHRGADPRAAEPGREPGPGPHPAPLPRAHQGDLAHQRLAARRRRPAQGLCLLQVRSQPDSRPAGTAPRVRDLRLRALCRGRASARRQGRARRSALVGPARGFPHRGAGPDEGPDGQERGDRAGGRQGRLRPQAAAARLGPGGVHGRGRALLQGVPARPARRHRQSGSRRHRPAARRRPLRRRRSLSRGRGRQGYRHLFRLRQRGEPGIRLLARRRLRLGRLGRLRPQENGHHRQGCLGIGQAAFPRTRARHPDPALHRHRHRRHVGRRVRQRHAAVGAYPARGRLRPPPHLHRPRSRRGPLVRRAPAPVRPAALELGRLRQGR